MEGDPAAREGSEEKSEEMGRMDGRVGWDRVNVHGLQEMVTFGDCPAPTIGLLLTGNVKREGM